MTATNTTEAPAEATPAKPRKQTRFEEAGVSALRQPNGDPFLGENGRFKPGYDAKLKSQLIELVLDPQASAVTRNGTALTQAEAEALLGTLNWTRFLDASREARANRATRRTKTEKATAEGEASADRLEQAKANKAAAQALVDTAVNIKVGRTTRLGKVLRVHRSVEDDILSPWVAVVAVPDDPKDADSAITEHEVPVADVKVA